MEIRGLLSPLFFLCILTNDTPGAVDAFCLSAYRRHPISNNCARCIIFAGALTPTYMLNAPSFKGIPVSDFFYSISIQSVNLLKIPKKTLDKSNVL